MLVALAAQLSLNVILARFHLSEKRPDTVGEPRLDGQSSETGSSCPGVRNLLKPVKKSVDIDGRSGRHVLQMRFGYTSITGFAETEGANTL